MRIAMLVALLIAVAPEPTIAQEVPMFANMQWGLSPDSVKIALTRRGYTFVKRDEDGDYLFNGKIRERTTAVWALMYEGRLAKVTVAMLVPAKESRSEYDSMKEQLIAKYGEPDKSFGFFERPYEDGDGYEETAISIGKAHFLSVWKRPTLGGDAVLDVYVREGGGVTVAYESPGWAMAAQERKKKSVADF